MSQEKLPRQLDARMRQRGYWSVPRAAEVAGVTRPTIRAWVAQGRVAAVQVGRRTFVLRASLAAYLGAEAAGILADGPAKIAPAE